MNDPKKEAKRLEKIREKKRRKNICENPGCDLKVVRHINGEGYCGRHTGGMR